MARRTTGLAQVYLTLVVEPRATKITPLGWKSIGRIFGVCSTYADPPEILVVGSAAITVLLPGQAVV